MALTFNGTSSKLEGANLITAFPFSMFAWIRPNSLTTDQMVMGVGDFGGNTEGAMFAAGAVAGDKLRAHSRNGSGSTSFVASDSSMALATWQPCLVVFRSITSRTVYFADGAAVGGSNSNTMDPTLFDRFVIGERPVSATLRANMDIAHAAVWADELGPDEWMHLRLGATPSDIRPGGLVDYWPLATTGATQTGVKGTVLTATDTATAGTSPTMGRAIPDGIPVRTDGIWTWFTEPRAVYYNGATYIGWVGTLGDIGITKYVHATKIRNSFNLAPALQKDDHNNASIYVRPDGRLIAFYTQHNDASGVRYRISTNAEDISAWGAEQYISAGGAALAYSNPKYLSGNGRLYLHFRRSVSDQYYVYSDDDGATWSEMERLFYQDGNRPYVKSISNGTDRIDFYLTDGHASKPASVYHCMAKLVGGVLKFYKSDGTTELTLPINVSADCTLIYNQSATGVGGWQWDCKYGADGHPRILFGRGVSSTDQRYLFARYTGSAWTTPVEITTGGAALYAGEPHYAHGMCFDADSVDTIYLARESGGISEIEKWATGDNGATWAKVSDITTGTGAGIKNARPIAPINAAEGMKLLWWRGTYGSYTSYTTDIYFDVGAGGTPLAADPATVASSLTGGAVTQRHLLAGSNATVASSLTETALNLAVTLVADSATVASGMTGGALVQHHQLVAANSTTDSSLTTGALVQHHSLAAAHSTTDSSLTTGALSQTHVLTASGLVVDSSLTTGALTQRHLLATSNAIVQSGMTSGAVLQHHHLAVTSLSVASSLTETAMTIVGILVAANATVEATMTGGAVTQRHLLAGSNATVASGLTTGSITQRHTLAAAALTTNSLLDLTAVTQHHALICAAATVNSALTEPAMPAQGSPLSADAATVVSTMTSGALVQRHILAAASATVMGSLTVTSIGGPTTRLRVWDGSSWVSRPLKVWDGSAWQVRPVRAWDGAGWIT